MPYTRADYDAAIRAALSDGNTQAASQLIKQRDDAFPNTERLRSFAQGATLGFADEAEAGVRSLIEDRPYKDVRDEIRAKLERYQRSRPLESLGMEMAGSMLIPGLGTLGAGKAAMTLGKSATIGAGLGALEGAGRAREPKDVLGGMIGGAGFGAAGGSALYGLGKLGKEVLSLFNPSPEMQASRVLRANIPQKPKELAKQLPWYMANLLEPKMVGEATPQLRGILQASTSSIPEGIAAKRLTSKAEQAGQRVINAAEESLGVVPGYHKLAKDLKDQLARTGKAAYGKAMENNKVEVTPLMRLVAENPMAKGTWKKAVRQAAADTTHRDVSAKLLAKDPEMADRLEFWHEFGSQLRIAAEKTRSPSEARRLRNLRSQVLNEVENQNPAYKEARLSYASEGRLQEAAKKGHNLFRSRISIDELQDVLQDMSEAERKVFQSSALASLKDAIASRTKTGSIGKWLTRSDENIAKLKMIFGDDEKLNKFMETLKKESDFSDLYNLAMPTRGSKTAPLIGQREGIGEATANMLLGEGPLGTVRGAVRSIFNRPSLTPKANEYLSNILTQQSPDPLINIMAKSPAPSVGPMLPLTGGTLGGLLGSY